MKRKFTVDDKRGYVKNFCKKQKCETCCLLMSDFCQLGNESSRAIREAFDIIMKNKKKKSSKEGVIS